MHGTEPKQLINYARTQQCAGQREKQGLGLRQGRRQDFEGGVSKKMFHTIIKECQHYNAKELVLCNFYSNISILRGCCPAKMLMIASRSSSILYLICISANPVTLSCPIVVRK